MTSQNQGGGVVTSWLIDLVDKYNIANYTVSTM